jgi:anti-sigma regulatory factor (Ser/Thr protein kinase)
MMEKAVFSAEIQELHQILEWVRLRLAKAGFEKGAIRKMELASEEALVNVINHGYAGRKGKVEIGLKWTPGHVEIVVRDWGPPFDPLANAPNVDPEAPLDERGIGGLGVYLMRQVMDEVVYKRENETNVLIMVKRFSQMK